MSALSTHLRAYFARQENPYAGADMERVIRLGGVLWVVGVLAGAALLPVAPPTKAVDPTLGWTAATVMFLGGLIVARRTFRLGPRMTDREMIMNAYTGMLSEAVFEWLAGGRSSPYHQLFAMGVIYVGVAHPPRRFALYGVTYVACVIAPFVYGPWTPTQAGDAALQVLITLALATIGNALLVNIRAQRVALRAQGAADRLAAETDALTGLGNRRALARDLEDQAARAEVDQPVLLALFDLDGFKAYNDAFGHPAGDALLARLGARLRDAVHGTAYRMGGDEFCVVARGAPARLLGVVEAAGAALHEEGDGFSIAASHGSVLLPTDTRDPSDALRIADTRMYANKGLSRTSAGRQTADVLLSLLAERDPASSGHAHGIADACAAVGRALGVDEGELPRLLAAGALHDIGKLAIPDAILSKPGPLTEAEWAFVRRHTAVAERILRAAPALAPVAPLVRSCGERFDGGGYPDGLAGEEIPLASRIVAVCDAFAAMTSDRPYRVAMSTEDALDELRRCAGTQFDPEVVAAFERVGGYAPSSPAITATAIASSHE